MAPNGTNPTPKMSARTKGRSDIWAKKNPISKYAVTLRNHKAASVVKNLANRRVVRKKLRSVTKKLKPRKVKKIIKEKSVLVGGMGCTQPDGATGGTTEYAAVGGGHCVGQHADVGGEAREYADIGVRKWEQINWISIILILKI